MQNINSLAKRKLAALKNTWCVLIVCSLMLVLIACSAVSNIVDNRTLHSINFDPYKDSTGIELLYYRYGSANEFGLRTTPGQAASGKPVPGTGMTGELPVGADFYAKWRVVSTGQIIEDTVNLKSRLPLYMHKQEIRPIIEGSQLYIYLISYDTMRPYFTSDEIFKIDSYATNIRQRAIAQYARSKVIQIYPTRIEDPQLPATFKK